jgi:hypothetical protein
MAKTIRLLTLVSVVAAQAILAAQGSDVDKILAAARQALGGDKKLEAVKSLAIEGRAMRISPAGTSTESEFEVAIELPDKFMRRDVLASMGNMSIYRNSGFNGDGVINEIDAPPQLAGGGGNVVMFRSAGPGGSTMTVGSGGTTMSGAAQTPEQQEAGRKAMLVGARQDFARMALGMFARSPAAYPLTMSFAGQAESPDGKADVIDVKGEGDFTARLFVDAATHLPLMLSWMAKEPLPMSRSVTGGPGGATAVTVGGGVSHGAVAAPPGQPTRTTMTPEERETLMKQLEEQRKEAEAKRRVVEYRLFYGDYRAVDGVQVPHRLQRSIDGKPTEEVTFEKVKVNAKIDAKKFAITK